MARNRRDVPSQWNSRNRPSAEKIMGLFFPFLFHNLFPKALFVFNSHRLYVGFAAQLWFSLIFLFPFPHKHEGKRLPQKQRVLDSFRLRARGKCPPGKVSDGVTLEGERGKGEGRGSACTSVSPLASALSPCNHAQTAPSQGHTEAEARQRPEE